MRNLRCAALSSSPAGTRRPTRRILSNVSCFRPAKADSPRSGILSVLKSSYWRFRPWNIRQMTIRPLRGRPRRRKSVRDAAQFQFTSNSASERWWVLTIWPFFPVRRRNSCRACGHVWKRFEWVTSAARALPQNPRAASYQVSTLSPTHRRPHHRRQRTSHGRSTSRQQGSKEQQPARPGNHKESFLLSWKPSSLESPSGVPNASGTKYTTSEEEELRHRIRLLVCGRKQHNKQINNGNDSRKETRPQGLSDELPIPCAS